jgi:hypothetical protein
MHLSAVRVVGLGPLEDMVFKFEDSDGNPRKVQVVLGSAGVGKTTLLSAIASTRPGLCAAQARARAGEPAKAAFVVADWSLGDDDPGRPHSLRVASPNAPLIEPDELIQLRRREQALFDRKALERGYALMAFSAARWFSRSPVMLSSPERSVLRYDVRASASFDDAARADLARETKQALSYSAVACALVHAARPSGHDPAEAGALELFDQAMRDVVGRLSMLVGYRYVGADPSTLEPVFEAEDGTAVLFDHLPTCAKHLVAFGALTLRTLQAAYPAADGRQAEGVVVLDEVELHQEPKTQHLIVSTLRDALPRVQWIMTTSSPAVALGCDVSETIALRRMPSSQRVELHEGHLATVH